MVGASKTWPDEIWAVEIDHEYSPSGEYYLSQPHGGERYIHHNIHRDQERYFKHMLETTRVERDSLKEEVQEARDTAEGALAIIATERAEVLRLREEVEQLRVDKVDLVRVVGELLARVDDAYAPPDGGISMHAQGQTPDWFVEAAILGTYGTLRKAALEASNGEGEG
jgi:hypothetical protein